MRLLNNILISCVVVGILFSCEEKEDRLRYRNDSRRDIVLIASNLTKKFDFNDDELFKNTFTDSNYSTVNLLYKSIGIKNFDIPKDWYGNPYLIGRIDMDLVILSTGPNKVNDFGKGDDIGYMLKKNDGYSELIKISKDAQ